MGLFSKSKSSSSSKVYTTTQNAGFSEVAGPAASNQGSDTNNITGDGNIGFRGNGNTVSVLDGGAIDRAFGFAENAMNTASGNVRESIEAVTDAARAETESVANQIKTALIYAVVVWGGVQAFKAFKG